jgi:hypothetical protein
MIPQTVTKVNMFSFPAPHESTAASPRIQPKIPVDRDRPKVKFLAFGM